MSLSDQNRALVDTVLNDWFSDTIPTNSTALNRLLDAARAQSPDPAPLTVGGGRGFSPSRERDQDQCGDAQEALPAELSKEEFCARFKARLLQIAGPVDGEGDSVADYADDTAPTYWDEPDQRAEGPEVCAETDHSYWE